MLTLNFFYFAPEIDTNYKTLILRRKKGLSNDIYVREINMSKIFHYLKQK